MKKDKAYLKDTLDAISDINIGRTKLPTKIWKASNNFWAL